MQFENNIKISECKVESIEEEITHTQHKGVVDIEDKEIIDYVVDTFVVLLDLLT